MKIQQENGHVQGLLQSQHRAMERANEIAKKMQADMLMRMQQQESNKETKVFKK